MAKKSKNSDPEQIHKELISLFEDFKSLIPSKDLRPKVLHLVKAFNKMRELGISMMSIGENDPKSARDRILIYFQRYTGQIISGDELLVVSGIQEYARRIRELRVQFGWPIVSGEVIKEMIRDNDVLEIFDNEIKSDSYLLLANVQDTEAAYRWNVANSIRKMKGIGVRDKILKFFRENVGKNISGDELRYVAGNKTEWARRVRELRTEYAWPIYTRNTGRSDLPIGTYLLEEDRQGEVHDRNIADATRIQVLERDDYSCKKCGWNRSKVHLGDPRKFLELHHIKPHIRGGANTLENLITLCNVCHDEIHKLDKGNKWNYDDVMNWLNNSKQRV